MATKKKAAGKTSGGKVRRKAVVATTRAQRRARQAAYVKRWDAWSKSTHSRVLAYSKKIGARELLSFGEVGKLLKLTPQRVSQLSVDSDSPVSESGCRKMACMKGVEDERRRFVHVSELLRFVTTFRRRVV